MEGTMTKYIDAERLKEKIYAEDTVSLAHGSLPEFDQGCHHAFLTVLSFIDSLRQERPIQINTLTWKDINDLERIINNVHYEFRAGIGEKSFGKEVLERFREERDEQDQPEVDLEKVIEQTYHDASVTDTSDMDLVDYENIARHFYELGQQEMRHRITNPEYNAKVVEQLKSEYPIIKE
jgi:hypothetical protein